LNITLESKIDWSMKVILATDPVFWPLTGIGKYTLELATRFSAESRLTDIRYFNMGRWQSAKELRQAGNENPGELDSSGLLKKSFGLIRKTLSNNQSAVKVYSRITPYLYRHRLKPFAVDYIYHSPNFMLPLFDGKKVATFHDLSVIKYPEFHPETRVSYLQPEIIKAAESADHIITDSEAVRQEVIEYFAKSPQDVTAVPLASSFSDTRPDPKLLQDFLNSHDLKKQQFFLFVSSIEPRKNIDRMLDAYELLSPSLKKQYPLVLVGSSGWKSEKVLQRIRKLSYAGVVHYLGYTTDVELKYLYHSAGALIFLSLYEGFGLPIIEAQVMGLPVVTSNLSCMPEVAGDAAMLVDPYDVDAISAALERVMLDEALRQRLKLAGFENSGRFSWDITAAKTLDVYSKV
jgi:alpha-1,3-rhamnosyl/mannosyltransferase